MKYYVLLALWTASLPTLATDSMRCKQFVISVGDPLDTVLEKCGHPSEAKEYSQPATYRNSAGDIVVDPSKLPIEYTEWIYDFGPTRLMRRIYAADQKIEKIETLGYGH